jgi:hypothetical protein
MRMEHMHIVLGAEILFIVVPLLEIDVSVCQIYEQTNGLRPIASSESILLISLKSNLAGAGEFRKYSANPSRLPERSPAFGTK